jgi:carotenoid 1,2-hydratase
MTDRGRPALRRSAHELTIGPSSVRWTGDALVIDIDERAALPVLGRLVGRVTLHPSAVTGIEAALTPDGSHLWRPFAPTARIEVALNRGLNWSGHGYFDANFGTRALEADFSTWTWGRFPVPGGAICLYDAHRRDGSRLSLALRIGADGAAEPIEAPPMAPLPRTPFLLARETRADAGTRPRQAMRLFEAPFYSRSLVQTRLLGMETTGMHEALDLDRFRSPLLKPILSVRVPRRRGWRFDAG